LASAETQEVKLVNNAGGALHTAGDFLVQDARQPWARSGAWALFRVLPNPFGFSATSSSTSLAPVDG
jgi:hypothetical protein